MMGLGKPESEGGTAIGYGSYSQKDADYTATSGNYEEKKEANVREIKERLRNYGLKGYLHFLYKKCEHGKYILVYYLRFDVFLYGQCLGWICLHY